MASEEPLCPVCGQPVGTVVGRHKTLGAWVPVWGSGPCRNPDCRAYAERPETVASAAERKAGGQAGDSAAKNS